MPALSFDVLLAGENVAGITLAGATIRHGAEDGSDQPAPATAYLELVTSDAVGDVDTYPGFTYGSRIPSGFTDAYVDTYEGTTAQLVVGAPISVVARSEAGYTFPRFTGSITAVDYTPGLVAVTAVSDVEKLTRVTIAPAGWPVEPDTARVGRIATAAGLVVRVEGDSSATCVSIPADAQTINAFEAMKAVANDADALFYATRSGELVYRTRNAPPRMDSRTLEPAATLLSTLKMTQELGKLANVVTVSTGDAKVVLEDADSIRRYGRRERTWSTQLDQASRQAFAERRLARFADPYWHMPTADVVVALSSTPAEAIRLLELDLDDELVLPALLPGSPVESYVSRLLGYAERLDLTSWSLSFYLDPFGWSLLDASDPPYVPPPLGDARDPQLEHIGTGRFRIRNYLADYTYSAQLITGSGTATLDTGTGVYTLSDPNARFAISTNGDGSIAGFAERKAYTFHTEDHGHFETTTSTVDNSYAARYEVTDIIGDPAQGPNKDQCPPGWWPINAGSPDARCWTQTGRWVCDNGGTLTDAAAGVGVYCKKIDTTTSTTWVPNVVTVRDGTPAGYVDKFGEWSRVT